MVNFFFHDKWFSLFVKSSFNTVYDGIMVPDGGMSQWNDQLTLINCCTLNWMQVECAMVANLFAIGLLLEL